MVVATLGAFALAGTASSSSHALQGHACEAQYDAASLLLATEIDGDGEQHTLQTKLDNAWRAFWKDKQLAVANGSLDTLDGLLASNATQGVGAQSKTLITEGVAEFRRCINDEVPTGTGTLAISVFRYDETTPGGKGAPAGVGVYVFVDGEHLALTDANGQATLPVPAGTVAVQAIVPSTSIAEASVDVAANTTVPLTMVLDDSKEVMSPVQLAVSSIRAKMLPAGFTSFTIALNDAGTPRAVTSVSEVSIEDDAGNTLERLTELFQVDAEGRLQPTDLAQLASVMARRPERSLVLRVTAEDAQGFTLSGTLRFFSTRPRTLPASRLRDAVGANAPGPRKRGVGLKLQLDCLIEKRLRALTVAQREHATDASRASTAQRARPRVDGASSLTSACGRQRRLPPIIGGYFSPNASSASTLSVRLTGQLK